MDTVAPIFHVVGPFLLNWRKWNQVTAQNITPPPPTHPPTPFAVIKHVEEARREGCSRGKYRPAHICISALDDQTVVYLAQVKHKRGGILEEAVAWRQEWNDTEDGLIQNALESTERTLLLSRLAFLNIHNR